MGGKGGRVGAGVGGDGEEGVGAGGGPLGGLPLADVGWLGERQRAGTARRTIFMVPSQELEQKVSFATRFQ